MYVCIICMKLYVCMCVRTCNAACAEGLLSPRQRRLAETPGLVYGADMVYLSNAPKGNCIGGTGVLQPNQGSKNHTEQRKARVLICTRGS